MSTENETPSPSNTPLSTILVEITAPALLEAHCRDLQKAGRDSAAFFELAREAAIYGSGVKVRLLTPDESRQQNRYQGNRTWPKLPITGTAS